MIRKLKRTNIILMLLLITSLIFHVIFGIEAEVQISSLKHKVSGQQAKIIDRDLQIEIQNILLDMQDSIIQEYITEPESVLEYIGEFEITYYTAGPESTGKSLGHPAYGITASGTTVKEGQTIAADWSVLIPGTKVYIEGIGERIVEDKGGLIKGNSIDVYVEDVEVALDGGRHMASVWIVEDEASYGK